MFPETLPQNGKNVLEKLAEGKLLNGFYLAGGTGLALELGHRESVDFDFFTKKDFNTSRYIDILNSIGSFQMINEAEGTVTGIFAGIKISFFAYNYPLIWGLLDYNDIKIADPREIGLMKFTAISGRGTKKDFIDLYWIAKDVISLEKLFSFFDRKYGSTYNQYHLLKSLIYFEDAEKDKMPRMLETIDWEEIKDFFVRKERELFNQYYRK